MHPGQGACPSNRSLRRSFPGTKNQDPRGYQQQYAFHGKGRKGDVVTAHVMGRGAAANQKIGYCQSRCGCEKYPQSQAQDSFYVAENQHTKAQGYYKTADAYFRLGRPLAPWETAGAAAGDFQFIILHLIGIAYPENIQGPHRDKESQNDDERNKNNSLQNAIRLEPCTFYRGKPRWQLKRAARRYFPQ